MAKIEWSCTAQVASVAAMNVNVLPLVVALVPNARFFWLVSVSVTLSKKLKEKGDEINEVVSENIIKIDKSHISKKITN